MKTLTWQRSAKLDGATWDLQLIDGRLNLWRNGVPVRTVYSDSRDIIWDTDQWPDEISAAWQEMFDVMRMEAGQSCEH